MVLKFKLLRHLEKERTELKDRLDELSSLIAALESEPTDDGRRTENTGVFDDMERQMVSFWNWNSTDKEDNKEEDHHDEG